MASKAALLSVSDRTNLPELAQALTDLGYTLLATSGTTKALQEAGIATTPIEIYTGQPEILDGRVKTLHPKIHAGLLAKRDNPKHVEELTKNDILPIEVAVVNLYPFIENLTAEKAKDPKQMVELVDIGGPTMIRAAAKNFASIYPVIDPADYAEVIKHLTGKPTDKNSLDFRRYLAAKVFLKLADYNLQIAKYFSSVTCEDTWTVDTKQIEMGTVAGEVLELAQNLRYGENPHQSANFYMRVGSKEMPWKQLGGKELSYNNFLDFDAASKLVRSLDQTSAAAVIVKHLNPCGAAEGKTLLECLKKAKLGDPRSHFGGVIAVNRELDEEAAKEIYQDFAEIVVAPAFSKAAIDLLSKKKNLRLIELNLSYSEKHEIRSAAGGYLIQEIDLGVSTTKSAKQVSQTSMANSLVADLDFAWKICSHVKSNAIVFARDRMLLAVGAGQMSRIDSTELAISKANLHQHNLQGAVCASDAFFPFPDSVEKLAEVGISAVIVPGGAQRDEEVIAVADKAKMALVFAEDRHFRH